jgi:hypothetical protein
MRPFLETNLPGLLDLLYDAALVPERWPAFFDRMSKAFADAHGVLHLYDRPGATAASISFGTAPEYVASPREALCGMQRLSDPLLHRARPR